MTNLFPFSSKKQIIAKTYFLQFPTFTASRQPNQDIFSMITFSVPRMMK